MGEFPVYELTCSFLSFNIVGVLVVRLLDNAVFNATSVEIKICIDPVYNTGFPFISLTLVNLLNH